MLNAIAGVGMIAVGVLGNPGIGIVQDQAFDLKMKDDHPAIHELVMTQKEGMLGAYNALDQEEKDNLTPEQQETVNSVVNQTRQATLAKIAILPGIMFICYLSLIFYFRSKGGYRAEVLAGHAAED